MAGEGRTGAGRAVSGGLVAGGLLALLWGVVAVSPAYPPPVTSVVLGLAAGLIGAGVGRLLWTPRLAVHLAALGVGQGAAYALVHDIQWHQRVQDPFYIAATQLRWPALVTLAYAAAVLGLGIRALRAARPAIPWARGVAAAGLLGSACALVMPHVSPFDARNLLWNFVAGGALLAVGTTHLWLIARAARPRGVWPDFDDPAVARRWGWGAAILAAALSVAFAFVALDGGPSLEDDIAMSWHARYFAAGRLYLDPPPVSESFDQWLVVDDGEKWFGYSPPGWPLVLALGFLVGLPWLVNPLLAMSSVRLVQRLVARSHGERVGLVAAVLMATSPWLLFMSGTRLAHPVTLWLALLGLTAMEAAVRKQALLPVVWGGVAIGALAGVRTYDAMVAGLPIALWSLAQARGWGARLRMAAVGLPAAAVPVAATLYYNHLVTGHWARFPNNLGMASSKWDISRNRLGFGPDVGLPWRFTDPLPGHGLADVLINTNHNLYYLNLESVGTTSGALGLLALCLVLGARARREDLVWVGLLLSPMLCFSFYWFSGGAAYGPKYWYLALPGVAVLVAAWGDRVARARPPEDPVRRGASAVLVAVILMSVLHYVPWRATERFRGRKPSPANLPALEALHDWSNALVFVRTKGSEAYGQAFVRGVLELRGAGPIYAREVSPEIDARLKAHFPKRDVWVIRGPDLIGGPYEVVESPSR